MTRPSLKRAPEQRDQDRDHKPWVHHDIGAILRYKPITNGRFLQDLINKHRSVAIISLRLLGNECIIIERSTSLLSTFTTSQKKNVL